MRQLCFKYYYYLEAIIQYFMIEIDNKKNLKYLYNLVSLIHSCLSGISIQNDHKL